MSCSLDYCDKPVKCRGYCNGHYHQLYRGEDLRPLRQPKIGCSFEGCDRKHIANGLCGRHNQQRLEGKELSEIGNYRGDEVSYRALHTRIGNARGSAAEQICVDCGEQASDWAYTYGCPNEKQSAFGPYTTDMSRYQPMCRPCHKLFDLAAGLVPA